MIEITLKSGDDFLKIKETLTRIGIANKNAHNLYQSCHILHDKGKYYISHFKELLAKERGCDAVLDEDDIDRMHVITKLLCDWKLCSSKDKLRSVDRRIVLYIINHNDKGKWNLVQKFKMGVDND